MCLLANPRHRNGKRFTVTTYKSLVKDAVFTSDGKSVTERAAKYLYPDEHGIVPQGIQIVAPKAGVYEMVVVTSAGASKNAFVTVVAMKSETKQPKAHTRPCLDAESC